MGKQVVRDWEAVQAVRQVQKDLEAHGVQPTWQAVADEINRRRVAECRPGQNVNKALVWRVAEGEVKFSDKLREALGLPPMPKVERADPEFVAVDRIIGGYRRECPQCTAKFERGEIEGDVTPDGYRVPPQYWMGNYFQRFCGDACKAEWHAERKAEREKAVTATVTSFRARSA